MTALRKTALAIVVAALGACSAVASRRAAKSDIAGDDADDQVSQCLLRRPGRIPEPTSPSQQAPIEFDVTNDG